MAYSWKILKGAVEQEILFPSEKDYEEYLAKYFVAKELPFEIVDEQENEDGTMTVIMRKPYNNNEFLHRIPEVSEEKFKEWFQKIFDEEAKAILREVEADQRIKDLKMSPDSYENLMEKIRAMEEGKVL